MINIFSNIFQKHKDKSMYTQAKPKIKKPKSSAKPINFTLKLLTVADTHNSLSIKQELKLPAPDQYDLCILLGDITKGDIDVLLKYIPKEKMIGVLGNHDDFDTLDQKGIRNINNDTFEFNGIRFTGLEGCFKYKPNQPGYTQKESKKICKALPDADILIAHNIPYGFLGNLNWVHIGNPDITNYLYQHQTPLMICGHNHCYKIDVLENNTAVIETYMVSLIEINNNKIRETKIETSG